MQSVNGQIPESVLTCALQKIMLIYKNPQDFINALNKPNMIPSLINIVKDCMKGTPADPNACNPPCKPGQKCVNKTCVSIDPPDPTKVCSPACNIGEICIQNGCVPPTWTRSFSNKFRDDMISDVQKSLPINKDIATCIIEGLKKQYPNPQKMINENQDTIQNLFNNLYKMCTDKPQPPQNPCNIYISDTCKSKGQAARNRGLDCGDTINECMTSGGASFSDDCIQELERISGETCENMKRQKPGKGGNSAQVYYYCNPAIPDPTNSDACGTCTSVSDINKIPEHFYHATDCGDLDNCEDEMYCKPVPELSSGIY